MKFHEKLQELRKQRGMTQEELASSLYVSRTAISKWESGRGYPSIDSLCTISRFFSLSLDELLSEDELRHAAEEERRTSTGCICDLVFGLLDICLLAFLFLPLFAQKTESFVYAVSLLSLTSVSSCLKIAYLSIVILTALCGILTLALQNFQIPFWARSKNVISILLNVLGALLFILGTHPYAAVLLLLFLAIKVFLLIKKR